MDETAEDTETVIFHNPRCSKSRGAFTILEEAGEEFRTVRYLDDPPDRATLERILDAVGGDPSELVRRDDRYRELGLADREPLDRDTVIEVLLGNPELLQRPVVLRGGRGVIARPPEKVADLFRTAEVSDG
mgnify:CR=1 FL=1